MLLDSFSKIVLRLPLFKKESLRRQDAFSQQISLTLACKKAGRSGQCNHPFESESPFQQGFHDHLSYLILFFLHPPSLKGLTAIRCSMQLTAVLKGEDLRLEEKEQIKEYSFN